MTPFRQLIKPGNKGRDVRAVKRTMSRMNVPGNGSLGTSNFAGTAFVVCVRNIQRNAHIKTDGVYGKKTHQIVAPHFRAYERLLYRTAKIRQDTPPAASMSAAQAAKFLLNSDKYHADNPAEIAQLKRVAQGQAVWSQAGYYVHIDRRVLDVLVYLIEHGHSIGTFAMCSDHHNDGPHGHSGGMSVDISSVDGISVVSPSAKAKEATLKVAKALHNAPGILKPTQLICDGFGNMHESNISACTIPSAGFYGYTTMAQHRNHIHVGY